MNRGNDLKETIQNPNNKITRQQLHPIIIRKNSIKKTQVGIWNYRNTEGLESRDSRVEHRSAAAHNSHRGTMFAELSRDFEPDSWPATGQKGYLPFEYICFEGGFHLIDERNYCCWIWFWYFFFVVVKMNENTPLSSPPVTGPNTYKSGDGGG